MKDKSNRIKIILAFGLIMAAGGTLFISASGQNRNQEIISKAESKDRNNILIAYFSLIDIVPADADAVTHATPSVGNTETVALEIQRQTGGDLFKIRTVQNYPASHRKASEIAGSEMKKDDRPALLTHIADMEKYDTVFIGYPIWWYMEPMAVRSFIDEYDFSGKNIIPFCTTLGAGIERSSSNIASRAKGAKILKGLSLRTEREDSKNQISSWLNEIGIK